MKKSELISKLSEKTGSSKAAAERDISKLSEIITEALVADDSITIPGIGIICTSSRKERKSYNIAEKRPTTIAAHRVAVLKPSTVLKAKLNKQG